MAATELTLFMAVLLSDWSVEPSAVFVFVQRLRHPAFLAIEDLRQIPWLEEDFYPFGRMSFGSLEEAVLQTEGPVLVKANQSGLHEQGIDVDGRGQAPA